MKASTCIVLLVALMSFAIIAQAKRFTLPGDAGWPTATQIAGFSKTLSSPAVLTQYGQPNYVIPATYNARTNLPKPAFILKPASVQDIQAGLAFARQYNIRISVISTGHHQDVRNSVDASIQFDMGNFNQKQFNAQEKTLTMGPGNNFYDLGTYLRVASNSTYVLATGAEGGVGPTGWTIGGGHGRLTRMFGLGADVVVSFDVVLANGTQTTVSASSHPELFRALRGSGGSAFCIIYSQTVRVFPDPGPTSNFGGYYYASDDVATRFQTWMAAAPNYAGAYYILGYDFSSSIPYVNIAAYCIASNAECDKVLAPLAAISGCTGPDGTCVINHNHASYTSFIADNAPSPRTPSSVYMASSSLNFEKAGVLANITSYMRTFNPSDWPGATIGCSGSTVLGGVSKTLDPNNDLTTVSPLMRNAHVCMSCYVAWAANSTTRSDLVEKFDSWAYNVLYVEGTGWSYWNEPHHNAQSNSAWQNRYWGGAANYARLLAVKRTYDPDNILTCYHCVGWEDIENVDPAVCPDNCSCSNVSKEGMCATD